MSTEGPERPTEWSAPTSERVGAGGGTRLITSHPSDLLGVLEVFVLDVYDSRHLAPGSWVIDLGAGIGDYAVLASRRVGPTGVVVAVEPNPDDFAILERNLRENDCRNVTPVLGALSDGSVPLELHFKDQRFLARPLSLPDLLRAAGLPTEALPTRPISLKIDIEGAEGSALRALRPLLPTVRAIAIELHATNAEVDGLLRPYGFEFHRLSRAAYLRNSLGFLFRHPVDGVRLWRRYRKSSGYSGLGKIVRGIDIAGSAGLQVGVYRRSRDAPAPVGPTG
jgi:FkbM family methyltransferase